MGHSAGANGIVTGKLSFEVAVGPTITAVSVRREDAGAHAPVAVVTFHARRDASALLLVDCFGAALDKLRGRADAPDFAKATVAEVDANGILAALEDAFLAALRSIVTRGRASDAPAGEVGPAPVGAAAGGERAEQLVDAAEGPGPAA